jgi:hypothetical protein
VYDCGFYPRSALEVDDSSEVRIEKIIRIVQAFDSHAYMRQGRLAPLLGFSGE